MRAAAHVGGLGLIHSASRRRVTRPAAGQRITDEVHAPYAAAQASRQRRGIFL